MRVAMAGALSVAMLLPVPAWAATLYLCDDAAECNAGDGSGWATGNDGNDCASQAAPCRTLEGAFAQMSGGDTLVIGDGTYQFEGGSNRINHYSNYPPSGSEGAYTIVQAEHPGQVRFDGEDQEDLLYVDGANGIAYVVFDGLQWVNPASGSRMSGAAHDDRTVHHVKFLRCGFEHYGNISYSSHVLLEDCYAWGRGRYPFIVFVSDHVILRRCISRLDAADGHGMPISNFINYASQFVQFQNCIAIDSNDDSYDDFEGIYGGFFVRESYDISGTTYQSSDTAIRGCMVLNVHNDRHGSGSGSASYSIGYGADNALIEHSVFWDLHAGTFFSYSYPDRDFRIDHTVFGITTTDDHMTWGNEQHGEVSSSLFFDIQGTAIDSVGVSTNNAFFGNGTDQENVGSSSGEITGVDPLTEGGLQYLPRIEATGALAGAGADGGDVGATILRRIGEPGSLWGGPGFDATTSECLWPWPDEQIVAAAFRSGVSDPPSDRGFAAEGQSLTRYVWEYLGNPMPAELCEGSGGSGAGATGGGGGAGGAGGAGGSANPPGASPDDDGGCGCRVGTGSTRPGAWWAALLALTVARRRRLRRG